MTQVINVLETRGKIQDSLEDIHEKDAYGLRLEANWRVISGEAR